MRFVSYYTRAISDVSGVTEALWGWASALVDAGQEVVVLHAGGRRRSPDPRHERQGLRDEAVPHRGNGRTTFRPIALEGHLRPGDVLLLHEGWVISNVIAARAARRVGCPYIVVPHGVYEPGIRHMLKQPRLVREMVERRLLEGAAAVHVFFESETRLVRALAPRTRRVIVAPIGFDVGAETWSGGGGYLAWIGRYDPAHKGIDLLLGAMALLDPAERPRLELRGPDYRGGFEATLRIIDRFGLGPWVTADGPVGGAEKLEFLRRSDGFVMPSRWESYGIALVENLALGVPCLASTAIQLAGPLTVANAAILARPTEADLAEGLRRLAAADPGLGRRGRSFVRSNLRWSTGTARFLEGVSAAISPVGPGADGSSG